MRFNHRIGLLPQPILRPLDHESSYEQSDLKVELSIDSSGHPHKIDIEYFIDQPDIVDLIKNGKAEAALAVHCDGTYYYELIDIALRKSQTIIFNEDRVFGKVYFCIIVRAVRSIPAFAPSNLRTAFSGMSFKIKKGDILAASAEFEENYGLPPMPVGDSIFDLVLQENLEPKEFTVDISDATIQVCVGTHLNGLIQQNMNTALGRLQNISSIYFPALIDVMYQVQGDTTHKGRAWYEAIGSAMSSLGEDIESSSWEPLSAAQMLLREPYVDLFIGSQSK